MDEPNQRERGLILQFDPQHPFRAPKLLTSSGQEVKYIGFTVRCDAVNHHEPTIDLQLYAGRVDVLELPVRLGAVAVRCERCDSRMSLISESK